MVAKALSLLDLLGEYPHGATLSDLCQPGPGSR